VLLSDETWKVFPEVLVTERLFGPSLKMTVPLGLTVKLIVPLPCFENVNGVGLVVTVITQGVGVGFAPGEADGEADGDADGDAPGDADGDADGDAEGDADGDADGDASGDADGDADGDAEGLAPGLAPGDGDGDGFGVLFAPRVDPLSIGLMFVVVLTFGTSSR
jgi:hypothetical protein